MTSRFLIRAPFSRSHQNRSDHWRSLDSSTFDSLDAIFVTTITALPLITSCWARLTLRISELAIFISAMVHVPFLMNNPLAM